MARLHGTVLDAATDEPVEAKVHVLSAMGRFLAPVDSILKVGPGLEFFYADGMFELEAPVVRWTSWWNAATSTGRCSKRWTCRPSAGWTSNYGWSAEPICPRTGGIPATRTCTTTTMRCDRTSGCASTRWSRVTA